MQPDYILIVGQGRSGTNWLLDLLDLSPYTHCRNEADKLKNSPFVQLPSPVVQQPFDENFGQQWDQAIAITASRLGERDRIGTHPKLYIYEPVRRLGGAAILDKPKLRQVLSGVIPSLGQAEWQVPWWFANPTALQKAALVLKLNRVPGWAEWVLRNRSKALVLHIVRHPGGFLNSAVKRYISYQDQVVVKRDNDERLRQIIKSDPQWAERFGDIEAMSIDELELWYWCYANEVIYLAGHERPNYVHLIYEDLVASPMQFMKTIYEKCNLPWTTEIEKEISKSASRSQSIATAWHKKLQPEQVELVRRVLNGSFMAQWWEE
jgi:hypothetical protein